MYCGPAEHVAHSKVDALLHHVHHDVLVKAASAGHWPWCRGRMPTKHYSQTLRRHNTLLTLHLASPRHMGPHLLMDEQRSPQSSRHDVHPGPPFPPHCPPPRPTTAPQVGQPPRLPAAAHCRHTPGAATAAHLQRHSRHRLVLLQGEVLREGSLQVAGNMGLGWVDSGAVGGIMLPQLQICSMHQHAPPYLTDSATPPPLLPSMLVSLLSS
jgi:hypothetical protein